MKQTWNLSIAFVLLGLLACAFGLWTHHLAAQREQEVLNLETASLELDRYEKEGTLAERMAAASEQRSRLEARLLASTRGAGSLDERLHEMLEELEIDVVSSGGWEASTDSESSDAVEFERTLKVSGSFQSVLNAVASLEAWPDLLRFRGLTIEPQAANRVAATLRLSVLRLPLDTTVDENGRG